MREICMSGSMSGVWKQSHGRASEAPPTERGGNRYVRPTATAPHLDSQLRRPDRNRLLLVGKFPTEVEPHCANFLRQRRLQPVAERAVTRSHKYGLGGW